MEMRGFIRVALKKINSNHFELKAYINGKKGRLILDTGASNSCIAFESVSYFNLKIKDSDIKAAGAGAINIKTYISENNTIKMGLWEKTKIPFVVFDLTHINQALNLAEVASVDGILGADVLKKSRAVIDYGRNCLYLKLN